MKKRLWENLKQVEEICVILKDRCTGINVAYGLRSGVLVKGDKGDISYVKLNTKVLPMVEITKETKPETE
jgi:hypothetical protein